MMAPKRIIFHIDVNSAFLSWSAIKRLQSGDTVDLRLVPSIIGGDMDSRHGIVTAKSIPAKKFNIETAEPVAQALKKCPQLIIEPPDRNYYRECSHKLMDYLRNICPDIEQVSIDECYMDFTPIAYMYESPEKAAAIIKDGVYETFGFTVNVGISDVKVLAKMASDFEKPNKVHTLYKHEIEKKMWPLPVGSLYMCGKSSTATLYKLGIRTIGDLAKSDTNVINDNLKSIGLMLHEFANGIDNSWVTTESEEAKGVGNSTTLSEDVTECKVAYKILSELCDHVATRLRKYGKKAGSVTVEVKYNDFRSCSHQKPLDRATASADTLHKEVCSLFDELWNGMPIRLLGVRTTKLEEENAPFQMSLFDYEDSNNNELDKAIDKIRSKYGFDAIKKGL